MRHRLPIAITGAVLLATSSAAAQELQLPKPEEVETGTIRPPAPDWRTGHFYFSGGVGATGPTGAMSPSTTSTYLAGAGLTATGSIGYGIARHASLHILGDYSLYRSPGVCTTGCSGRSFSVGFALKYHLAQGIAFDPWASYGMALRFSSFQAVLPSAGFYNGEKTQSAAGTLKQEDFRGVDIARLALGGDFYPTPWLGFGPFLEVDLGTNVSYPILYPDRTMLRPQDQTGVRAYAFFQVGFRVAFDPMRRPASPAPAAATVTTPPRF